MLVLDKDKCSMSLCGWHHLGGGDGGLSSSNRFLREMACTRYGIWHAFVPISPQQTANTYTSYMCAAHLPNGYLLYARDHFHSFR